MDAETIAVRVAAGELRGTGEAGLGVFRGIPFARPPVGELRFAAPRPVASWEGARDAMQFGPPPPQAGFFGMDALVRASDDWLTLNVWTPDFGARLPVMVWIQGGGYGIGVSSLPEYDGACLARDGVVVVTFNYRVGVEGFGQIDGMPANRGLLDQVAALEWVRDNIHAFGGDPDQVTIFGESAGGGSVAALMAMPRAAGLFHRAIAQSVPGTFFHPALASDITAALGLPNLSEVEPRKLAEAADAVMARIGECTPRWGLAAQRAILFAPVVDGDILPATPWQALADGAGRDVDLVVGHTRDEHRLFMVIEGLLGTVTPEQAANAMETFAPQPYGHGEPEQLYELVHSDWLFRMPSLHLAESQIIGGGRAHLYELTWPGALGACHGLDVPLVFGNLAVGGPAMLIGGKPEAAELSARMREAWIGFATTGDPGWPTYDAERRLTQVFDSTSIVTPYPEDDSRQAWRDHRFDPLPLLDPTTRVVR
ncbi:carboxylesterase/lipase family protein [Pseudonocardia sp. GCM10023141]|uniref:carboxylesterase/lipase family protein n=1 Tax=Pseudonocardia sp. GCM10023141 TaxID=3252653 RepID=UPI003615D7AE